MSRMSDGKCSRRVDDDLVEEARNGSRPAMLELYARHRGLVVGYVLRLTGDRELADEVFAATFTTFFAHLPGYRARGRLAGYLLRIARSRLADELRARARLGRRLPAWTSAPGTYTTAEPVDTAPDPGEAAARSELAGLAEQAVRRLSRPLREVVVLRLYEGLDHAQIAELVRAGEATVRSRLRYALQALRRALNVVT
jgi:RNA polymerase sigma-70 factor (ECF subfamily)